MKDIKIKEKSRGKRRNKIEIKERTKATMKRKKGDRKK